jgi:hypothetical protein
MCAPVGERTLLTLALELPGLSPWSDCMMITDLDAFSPYSPLIELICFTSVADNQSVSG